jgi:ubiquinone/menaquinone biosynthesis C-methylase UbiE
MTAADPHRGCAGVAADDGIRAGAHGGRRGAPRRVDYEFAADAYLRTRTVPASVLAAWRAALTPFFGDEVSVLADVGAGTGQFADPLAQWFGVTVVALEPSAGMRRVAKTVSQDAAVRYVAGRGEAIPLSAASVDRAWLSAVVHHLDDVDVAASEVVRVVRPGGLVLIRGFFQDLPVPPLFAAFPGIERTVRAFPSTAQVTDAFAANGIGVVTQRDVVEVHEVTESWEANLRTLRSVDSLLRPLSDAEFEAGIASLRAASAGRLPADAHRVTMRLVVCRV